MLTTWPGSDRLVPTLVMAPAPWTVSVTWPRTWPARCQASATAIAPGMNAACRQQASHGAGLFREARFRRAPLAASDHRGMCGRLWRSSPGKAASPVIVDRYLVISEVMIHDNPADSVK